MGELLLVVIRQPGNRQPVNRQPANRQPMNRQPVNQQPLLLLLLLLLLLPLLLDVTAGERVMLFDLEKYHRENYSSRKHAKAAIALWPWRQLQKGLHPLREERFSTRKRQTVKAAAALRTGS